MRIREVVFFLLIFSAAILGSQSKADEIDDRIDSFLTSVVSSKDRSLLEDKNALLKALSVKGPADYRRFIERMLNSGNQIEALVLRNAWKTLALEDRQSSAIASASILLESGDSSVVTSTSDIMRYADDPESDSRWDFSQYNLVLETVGRSESARLLSYMFEQSPAAGLQSVIGVFGDGVSASDKVEILEQAWDIEEGLRKPGDTLVGEKELNAFLSFAESLQEKEPQLFAPYIAAVLLREKLRNVSPELREQLEGSSALARSFFSEEIEQSAFPALQTPIFDELVSLSETSERSQPDDTPKERDFEPERGDITAAEADLELPESPSRSPIWPYVVVAVAILGIVVVLLRSRKGKTPR